MKRVSLKDIARELGVSTATVSLVLNGKNMSGRVSSEMSQKILDKASELNYIPNTLAKGLKVGKSRTIGLIIADISNLFFGALALHIQIYAEQRGYSVIIGNTNEQLNEMENLMKFLYARQVEGLIITPTENSQYLLKRLISNKIPFVLVDRSFPELPVNSVLINNYEISYRSTGQLIKKGCKRIGLITYKQDHYHINERKRGSVDAMKHAGIYDPEMVEEVRYDFLKNDIKRAICNLISKKEKTDGLFFTTNSISINGVKELIRNNINIQKDIQIMCFDENDAFYILPYAVPFIKQPIKEMAKNAVELLIDQIEMKSEGTKNVVVGAELVLNENMMYL
ncbi:MAG: LacI family DNA-binding transcriptional regulator [Petrimonas sp.]|uniref:HTH-type transcriptional repressor CytR n=1 Tax=bioreactor metagenome TaxID=1076179 RepID=A0A644XHG9_9ZZZZ|nr:LacI family DNA-binding transcriptional regulator [Petrimonas sp.]NLU30030.1 LacI family transcriptional regulator [Bacteroidales bacterium]BBD44039.1 Transcriptional regulator, LacI family [Petrimonas sp. IBARAKI]HAC72977.1 LacI family transcriptional regulator [Porphyromonadaceae bacterium]MDD3543336.1 LacI family DNA-binding transcriptional regulator [Petrimonas sp.]